MRSLELPQLLGVRRVGSFAVGDREGGLPGAGPDAEGRLESGVAAFAKHRRTRKAFLGDPLPPKSDLVGRAERLEAGEARDLRRDPDRRELPTIAAQLVDPERGHDLLDALAEGLDEIAECVRVSGGDRVLEQEVWVHGIRTERQRDHYVVEIPDAAGRDHERAVPTEGWLRDERAMRRRDHEVRVEPGAAFAHDTVIANDDELRAGAHAARGGRAEPSQSIARVLFPIPIGLEEDRRDLPIRRQPRDGAIEQPPPLPTGQSAEARAPPPGPGGLA